MVQRHHSDAAASAAAAAAARNRSPMPGYQSLSPPPRMSALPLAVPGAAAALNAAAAFRRSDPRYHSLPTRIRSASTGEFSFENISLA